MAPTNTSIATNLSSIATTNFFLQQHLLQCNDSGVRCYIYIMFQRFVLASSYLRAICNIFDPHCNIKDLIRNNCIFIAICKTLLQHTIPLIAMCHSPCNMGNYCNHQKKTWQYHRRNYNKTICIVIYPYVWQPTALKQ